jgi:hypothetical protein
MKWLVFVVCAACGDNLAPPVPTVDAPPPATGCTATFTGNFSETSTEQANCPTFTSDSLAFALASTVFGATDTVTLALGTDEPGEYSSDSVANWSATATERVGDGACELSAGSQLTPMGSFALTLTSGLHGTLAVTQYVLTVPGTNCGFPDTESITVAF